MRVVITGGAGFLGQRLARAILRHGLVHDGARVRPDELLLVDRVPAHCEADAERAVTGDISDPALVAKVIAKRTGAVFHLAAVVSAEAEADFDLGMRINLDATRAILERCRALEGQPRLVFPSSVAAFGGSGGDMSSEAATRPMSSYGTQKAVGELLVNNYARKGFVDGRAIRLPTIVIRPGRPNRAASSFASSIFREPLNGERAVCPVPPSLRMWLASPDAAVAGLMQAHDVDRDALPPWRVLNMPGLGATVGEMVAALARQGGDTSLIDWQPDSAIEAIVGTWPARIETALEEELGFMPDASLDAIVTQFLRDRSAAPG